MKGYSSSSKLYCRICKSEDIKLYCTKRGYRIFKCFGCFNGFLDLSNIDFNHKFFYQSYYDNLPDSQTGYDNYFLLEKALKLTFKKRMKKIKKYIPNRESKKRLLDIGCGPGYFLEKASRDFNVCGVEVSKTAADYAKNNLGLEVINSAFKADLFDSSTFDIAIAWDVIEHVEDANLFLKDLRRVIKEKGILAITTGDFSSLTAKISGKKWHLFNLPEHLFYFTKKGLIRLLEDNGFDIIHLSYPFSYYSLDYLRERLVKSLNIPWSRKFNFNNGVLKKIILPVNLFDIMLVIAKRRKNEFS